MDYTHTTKPDQTNALYLHQQLYCKNKRHSVRSSKNAITYYSFLILKKFIFSTPTGSDYDLIRGLFRVLKEPERNQIQTKGTKTETIFQGTNGIARVSLHVKFVGLRRILRKTKCQKETQSKRRAAIVFIIPAANVHAFHTTHFAFVFSNV